MAEILAHPGFVLLTLALFLFAIVNAQQNIETYYPSNWPPIPPPTPPASPPPLPPPPPPAHLSPPTQSPSGSNKRTITTAVLVTAASTLVVTGLFLFLFTRYASRRRKEGSIRGSSHGGGGLPMVSREEFKRFDGNIKGLIVDENGLDVLYWRKLQAGSGKSGSNSSKFRKEVFQRPRDGEVEEGTASKGERQRNSEPIQEVPLLRGRSSTSHNQVHPEGANDPVGNAMRPPPSSPSHSPAELTFRSVEESSTLIQLVSSPVSPPPPPLPPPTPLMRPTLKSSAVLTSSAIVTNGSAAMPPPPPPSPPPIPAAKAPTPPPPPPPRTGGLTPSGKLPPPPQLKATAVAHSRPGDSSSEKTQTGTTDQVKLKPLHWDKFNIANADHSMVWNKIEGGSFKVDDDLMGALFGTVATNRKSPKGNKNSASPGGPTAGSSGQIFILDSRKSQNIAIVLKSLTVSRQEILEALTEGQGLSMETLEKFNRIAPTKEEESQILDFAGDPTRLADAESFLYHLLKAVPSAFSRFSAMLFRLNYESEILQLRESLRTLELACKELRTRGLFMKLLEAILKAGNRMNAGTSRGNAQAFDLTSLRKLSDVKSINGKTTLLHFVVEEVVRVEGKRCVVNRNQSLSRTSSQSSSSSTNSETPPSREEREKEYMMLGLPVVGGLSSEFSNVKKAAAIDYETFYMTCAALKTHTSEIRDLVSQGAIDGGGFVRVMQAFLKAAEEELSALRKEQTIVIENVKRTTEYYQGGASKRKEGNPLQLFGIVRDFLNMVDQACVEITRNQQGRKTMARVSRSSPPDSPPSRTLRFPKLPPHFLSENPRSPSSESHTNP